MLPRLGLLRYVRPVRVHRHAPQQAGRDRHEVPDVPEPQQAEKRFIDGGSPLQQARGGLQVGPRRVQRQPSDEGAHPRIWQRLHSRLDL